MALGDLVLAGRVAAGLFVIVMPTLLFLALWHGLQAMKDDELVQRVRERADAMDDPAGFGSPMAQPRSPVVACPNCGAGNRDGVAYCKQCLSPLSRD